MIQLPEFNSKSELFAHLRANKSVYLLAKKAEFKHADAVICAPFARFTPESEAVKAFEVNAVTQTDKNILPLSLVINTTNLRDSHKDVHIQGLWKKTLAEQKNLMLLQEHRMQFDKIISDKVQAFTREMMWNELGASYMGITQALVFNVDAEKDRNPYMIEQYEKGYVKNHSVGMRYVQLFLAMKSDDRRDIIERETWEKYASQVHNLSEFEEEEPYFWAVTEAKLVEGSAVPLGSNQITPTLIVGQPKQITVENEPPESTQEKAIDWDLIKQQISINLNR